MNIANIWTLQEARETLTLWKTAYKNLAAGQVKEYQIGSRKLTYLDLEEIEKQINKFAEILAVLEGRRNTKNVRTVVPRDM